jgi:YD repeat-containing protein
MRSQNGVNSSNLISVTEISADGLRSWNILWNNGAGITNSTQTSYDSANGYRIVTRTAPDGSYTVATNQSGRLISVTSRDSTGAQIGRVLDGHDALIGKTRSPRCAWARCSIISTQ